MRQARTVLSTYSADTFGICSALYELGGMIVMHDASGCNSTYSTHDEPRWYNSDSMVYISGLTEMDAILGNDEKLICDMAEAIEELKPAFAVIAGTPIPMMTGFDYRAVAAEVEERTGIPCFGFSSNGMNSYLCGASEALAVIADVFTEQDAEKKERSVNILGATPLDFSLSGTVESIKDMLEENGWDVISCWAMGSSLDELKRAGEARVNLVISSTGVKTAKLLKKKFGTPYVIGTPAGEGFSQRVMACLEEAADNDVDMIAFDEYVPDAECEAYIVGESVMSRSIAAAIGMECGFVPKTVSTLEALTELDGVLSLNDIHAMEEEEIQDACKAAKLVIADPLYRPVLPESCRFIPLPHEAFSGRMFRKDIPDLTKKEFIWKVK